MGVLQYRSNGQLDAEEADEQAKLAAQEQQSAPLILGLAAHVRRCWEAAKDAKNSPGANGLSILDRINSAIRRRRGLYDEQTEDIIRQNGPSKVFLKLTDEKCHAAKSWLLEALLPAGEKPWGVEPTKDPSIPPAELSRLTEEATQQAMAQFTPLLEMSGWVPGTPLPPDVAKAIQGTGAEMRDDLMDQMRKQARKAAQDVEDAIEDAMDEGGWATAMAEFLDDLVTYPTAIFKGPVWESGRHMSWDEQGQPVVSTKLKLAFKRIDPNNIYPGPRATGPQDGYLIERHVMSRLSLRDLIGVEGYDELAIKAVLEAGKTGLEDWTGLMDETERRVLLDQQHADRDPEGRIDALQFWGWVQGQQLIDYGIDAERIPDPLEEYHAEVWLIDQHVIKAELNGDPLGRRPYHAASYRPRPGSWWGEGIPEIIADIQDLCNATVRALENNMAWGSGAQVGIDVGAMPEGEPLTEMFPAKIWQFDLARSGQNRTPIWFFQPELRAAELLKVYDYLSQEADNKTGIPRYAYGQTQSGGPIGTASGYSMMIQNMSKAIGAVISGLDVGITEPVVRMTFETLILDGVIEYRGDIDVKCQGSKAILEKNNLMARRTEFIGQAMQSEMLLQLIGMEGMSDILRAHVRELAIGADDAIPTAEAIRRKEEMGQMQQRIAAMQQGMMPGQPGQPGQPAGPQQGQPGPLMGQLAAQATHPQEDKLVAHISPKEAALLKSQGGAGTINPQTGLPEFYTTDDSTDRTAVNRVYQSAISSSTNNTPVDMAPQPAIPHTEEEWAGMYNTPIPADRQMDYEKWKWDQSLQRGRDITKDAPVYDIQGAALAGMQRGGENMHFPDTYKKPSHTGFSTDSQYNGLDGYDGGKWGYNKDTKQEVFTPSATNWDMNSREDMMRYVNAPGEKQVELLENVGGTVMNVNPPKE